MAGRNNFDPYSKHEGPDFRNFSPSDAAGEVAVSHVGTTVDTGRSYRTCYSRRGHQLQEFKLAIIAPKTCIGKINDDVLQNLPGHLYTYKSMNTVVNPQEAVH